MKPAYYARIRPDILTSQPYVVPDVADVIKLDAMENPFGLPAPLAAELGQRLGKVSLNRYPAPHPAVLLEKLKHTMQVPQECDILSGNGSDELIHIMSVACARPGATVLAPVPGFAMVDLLARLAQLNFVGVPLAPGFTLDVSAMCAAIRQHSPAVIYLAYPNNPTGNLYDDADIECVIDAACSTASLVVIDEAYQPFARRTWMSRLPAYEHVLVMRTFSKLGLAGIRLGYMAGAPALIRQLDKVRLPYNINVLTQAAVDFLLDHLDVFEAQAAQLCEARALLASDLARHPGVTVFPSAANFLLVRVPNAPYTFDHLLAKRILVKNVSGTHPLLANCLRITIGQPHENAQVLNHFLPADQGR